MKAEHAAANGEAVKSKWRENVEAILLAILLALFIRTFVVQAFKIPSGSMQETLLVGDHILVNKFIYGVKLPFVNKTLIPIDAPERGDIVVFKFPLDPGKDFIKRVIGLPGDSVEIRDKRIFINGEPYTNGHAVFVDPHILPQTQQRDNLGPITVPEDKLFVMGDNRDQSYDSRFWGFVDQDDVKGKAFMIYFSWDKEDFGIRWSRIGQLLE